MATPAIARKLIHISKYVNISIDEKLYDLAQKDCIVDNNFGNKTNLLAAQFIIDSNFRAVISEKDISRKTLIDIIYHNDPFRNVIICCPHFSTKWQNEIDNNTVKPIVTNVGEIYSKLLEDPQYKPQNSLLVMDWDYVDVRIRKGLAREFPQTIIYTTISETSQRVGPIPSSRMYDLNGNAIWWDLANALFPAMPVDILEDQQELETFLEKHHWKTRDRNALAALYNVFLPNFHIE